MPTAARSILVIAALVLLAAVITLGVRGTGDDGDPTALPSPTDTTIASSPAEALPSPSETVTGTEPTQAPTGDGTTQAGTDRTDGTGTQDGDTAGDGTDASGTEGTDSGDEGDATDEDGTEVDDMPETGGGAATALGGLVALGAAAGLARRRG